MKMRRFLGARLAFLTILMLFALIQSVCAEQPQVLGNNAIAKNGGIQIGAGRNVTEPELMIRIGESQFDPLYHIPAQSSMLNTIQHYAPGRKGYFIVQFDGPIQSSWKTALRQSGAEIFDYLPDFSFIVRMSSDHQGIVENMPNVRWVGIYQPSYRISRRAMGQLYSHGGQGGGAPALTILRVDLFPGVDLTTVEAHIAALGGVTQEKFRTDLKSTLKIEIPANRIADLPAIDGVKWIEPAPQWKLLNDVSTDVMRVRAPRDTHGLYGSGQVVGVADTGLDQGVTSPANLHDDFEDGHGASRVLQIIDRVAADESGIDQSDVNGHGTHVAGSVLGNGIMSGSDPAANSFPLTSHAGTAPKASLFFQALENNDDSSLAGIPYDLNDLFSEADSAGAHLHTNSWGSPTASAYTVYSQDVDEYVWTHPDFLILFAAGNSGIDMDADGIIDSYSIGSPATAKNCLTVGASEGDRPTGGGYDVTWGAGWGPYYPSSPVANDHVSNNDRGMAAFSSRGPTLDGRYKPDIVAPGTNILSTRTGALPSSDPIGWGNFDDYYVWMGGTSMATPLAAGAAALMREYLVTVQSIGSPSAALIKAALINSAEDISPGQYGTGAAQEIPDSPVPNHVEGWGRLSLADGVYPAAPFAILFNDETSGLSTGEYNEYTVDVSDSGAPLRINLTWTDYPGAPSAQGGLVNDLDLQITDPSATVTYPDNALQKNRTSTITHDTDTLSYYNASNYAVRFTPSSYPAYLDSTTFAYYNDYTTTSADVAVYGDNGSGRPDITNEIFRKTLSFIPVGLNYITIPLNLTIAGGDVHIAIERAANTDIGMVIDDNGNPTGRTSWRSAAGGSSWATSPYTAIIRANVRYSADFATTFDRVNNSVGVVIDSPAAGRYTVRVSGYNIPQGPQPYALVASGNIIRNGILSFNAATYSVNENAGSVTITVQRTDGSRGAASVDYVTSDGSATDGSDYSGVNNTLTWADGDSADKSFTVAITDDATEESDETIHLTLTNASGAALGSTSNAIISIKDNDAPGSIDFTSAAYSVAENAGSVTITVQRTDGSRGAASVDYVTSDGTAVEGSDYTGSGNTLNWADGDSADKFFTVNISDDTDDESNETINLTLTNASGAALGSVANAVLTINDNDVSGGAAPAQPASSGGGGGGGGCFIITSSH